MRLVCYSHWPPQPCFVTQTCYPHFFFLKLAYPTCNCAYINTFTSIHCLHIAMNVDGRNIFCSQELNNSMLFEPHILTTIYFDWHWTGVTDCCGFKVMYGGEEMSHDCMEPVVSSFHYSNKKYDIGGKTFHPILVKLGKFDITISWLIDKKKHKSVGCVFDLPEYDMWIDQQTSIYKVTVPVTVSVYDLNASDCKSHAREGEHNTVLLWVPYCSERRSKFVFLW